MLTEAPGCCLRFFSLFGLVVLWKTATMSHVKKGRTKLCPGHWELHRACGCLCWWSATVAHRLIWEKSFLEEVLNACPRWWHPKPVTTWQGRFICGTRVEGSLSSEEHCWLLQEPAPSRKMPGLRSRAVAFLVLQRPCDREGKWPKRGNKTKSALCLTIMHWCQLHLKGWMQEGHSISSQDTLQNGTCMEVRHGTWCTIQVLKAVILTSCD
jgi:hypothetical protein